MLDRNKNFNRLLEDISVHEPGMWHNEDGPIDWYGVSREEEGGIIAYFEHGPRAYDFRLFLINAELNPLV